jgi:hypothetical protein
MASHFAVRSELNVTSEQLASVCDKRILPTGRGCDFTMEKLIE